MSCLHGFAASLRRCAALATDPGRRARFLAGAERIERAEVEITRWLREALNARP